MTTAILEHPPIPPWNQLPSNIRDAPISCKWIGSDGEVWPLTGLDAGIMGAFVSGAIEGMVHVPFDSVWTKPAYGPPVFERTIDARREISFRLGLYSDSGLGWFDTESRWWRGCKKNATGFFSVTTLRNGELWLPMQLLEAPKCKLEDDPSRQKFALHDIVLAVDGDPRWRRPDVAPPPFIRPSGETDRGYIRIANRGTEPAWPIFILSAPGQVYLPDGPNAFTTAEIDAMDDWPKLGRLFGIPLIDELLGTQTRTRTSDMIKIPKLNPGENAIIDTDPAHRIAITTMDPIDNILKKFLRNSELLDWIVGEYGDSGLPLLQRFEGQGFSIPIPPRSVATLPVQHSRIGGRIYAQLPQRFESALAAA